VQEKPVGRIHPNPQFQPFDAKTAEVMRLAFHTAWQALLVSGSELVASFRAQATREALVLRIIELARDGERDVVRLRDQAVAYVLQAKQAAPTMDRPLGSGIGSRPYGHAADPGTGTSAR
jgi:hypothetical protein